MLSTIAAFLTAALAGMGVGGGGLLVLYFAFFSNFSQQEAQGINLLCFLCAAGAGLAVHLKKRKLRLPLLALFAGAALLTALPGVLLAEKLTSSLLRRLFGGLMAAGGLLSLFEGKGRKGRKEEKGKKEEKARKRRKGRKGKSLSRRARGSSRGS